MAFTPGVHLSRGTELTTFTLALATTAEVTQAAGGKAATKAVLNQLVAEVNKIYEAELAITFQLHPLNDRLIFENAATDGYTNGVAAALIVENPIVVNTALNGSAINDSGYDFGHVLGLGGDGGLAGVGIKARGATDLLAANASFTSVKSFAHELGHQFNASHTVNGLGRDCGPNRNPTTAVEPGSGSTLMSYQGICDNDNLPVFPGDSAYLHALSFDEMAGYISGTLAGRGSKASTGNSLPTVSAGTDRTIPAGTPFTLAANASDSDAADKLTYTWEQIDASPTGVSVPIGNSQDQAGPLFRSFAPTADASRTFPRIQDLAANLPASQNKNEHLPSQNRDLNFRVTVRDNHQFNGRTVNGIRSDDLKLTVVNTGGPFRVTTLNGGNQPVAGGSQLAVNWDVAGTTANGINTTQVDILLSVDGGLTYPLKLAAQTANDGSANVTIPNLSIPRARIKVQADPTQNVFFDINDFDFQITQNANAPGGVVIVESGGVTKVAEGLFVQTGLPGTDTYTIALTQPATSDVDITFSADSQMQVSADGTTFTATQTLTIPAGSTTPRTITVKAVNDTLSEGVHTGLIRQAVTRSNDPNYSPQILISTVVPPVLARMSDDESPPLIGAELDFDGPDATVPANWTRIDNPFGISAGNLIRENGESTTIDLTVAIANPAKGAGWSSRTLDLSTVPAHSPDIGLIDDSMFWDSTPITATWNDLKPRSKYRVYVFAASEADVDGEAPIKQTITISGNGNDNPAPFLQDGTGKVTGAGQSRQLQLLVNSSVGSSANQLEQYGLAVTSTADGKITVRVDPAGGGHSVLSALAVQELLEPLPGFTLAETNGKTEVTESAATDSFSVVLDVAPTSTVIFSISSANTAAATVDKSALTFTPQNWDTPQSVTVTGVDDSALDGDRTTIVTVSVNSSQSEGRFAGLPSQNVQVTTKENDVAGIVVTETGGKTEVTESGTTDQFTVALSAQPAANVVLTVFSTNTSEATVAPATLTFTPQDWNVAQTVTVTGVDDSVADGERSVNLTISVNTAQSATSYANAPPKTVAAINKDNELSPWQNAAIRFDVSGDGSVVPLDVLRVINELNEPKFRDPVGRLPATRPSDAAFYDVNGDGFVTTNDALQIINFINTPTPEGEHAEASGRSASDWQAIAVAYAAQRDLCTNESDFDSILDEIARDVGS